MLKDITIGQYFPGDSAIHRLDPRMKIILTFMFVVLLFVAVNPIGFAVAAALLVFSYATAKIPMSFVLKGLKPILPLVLFTGVLNMFFIPGDPIVSFWGIQITYQGVLTAVLMALRIVLLIAGSSLLTYTTSPIEIGRASCRERV